MGPSFLVSEALINLKSCIKSIGGDREESMFCRTGKGNAMPGLYCTLGDRKIKHKPEAICVNTLYAGRTGWESDDRELWE